MRPAEKIKRLIKDRRYKADAETYDKALGSFLQAVDEHLKQKAAPSKPNLWRTIMTSRITKLATATVILIVAYVVIYQAGGEIDATVSFAQITENMKQMPWLHAVVEGAGDRLEAWFSFERRAMAQILTDGRIRYQDYFNLILLESRPATNKVTVTRGRPDDLVGMGRSALDFPKNIIRLFEDAGEKIIRDTGKYKGKDVNVFKMSGFLGGMDMKIEMTIDSEKHVLLYGNQKAFDKTGKLAMEANGYFDYPEKGPESIYDIGVPTSAKTVRDEKEEEKTAYDMAFEQAISVIDTRESWPEPRDLVISYWQHRNAKNYDEMAILWPNSAMWNQSLEKEEPVEYVFGEVNTKWAEGYIVVPYASKSYYDKHGKYSLKMVLSDKKSTKGRYYIVSGN